MASLINNSVFAQEQQITQQLGYQLPSKTKGIISYICGGWSGWQLLITILLLMITYDQGLKFPACPWVSFRLLI
jgi:hypothetical protein